MKKATLFWTFITLLSTAFSQNLNWVKSLHGGDRKEISDVVKHNNAIYIVGSFDGLVDFDPGNNQLLINSVGNYDMFIQKMSSNGDHLWTISLGDIGYDHISSIKIINNQIYLAGVFSNTVDFDPGINKNELTADIGGGSGFVLSLSESGALNWVKNIGDALFNVKISNDSYGNVYAAGIFMKKSDFDPGTDTAFLTPNNNMDVFITKYDSLLNFKWVRQLKSDHTMFSRDIELLNDSVIVIVGEFNGHTIFNYDASIKTNVIGGLDGFVLALKSNGEFKWVHHVAGGSAYVSVNDVEIIENEIMVVGHFIGFTNFLIPGYHPLESKDYDAFIMKLVDTTSVAHRFQYAKNFGGSLKDYASSIHCEDNEDYCLVTGSFEGKANLYPNTLISPHNFTNWVTSNGEKDIFIQRIHRSSGLNNEITLGGVGTDFGVKAYPIEDNKFLIIGVYSDTVNFSRGPIPYYQISDSNSSMFISEYNFNPTGINEQKSIENEFKIFPNPTSGRFTIILENLEKGDIQIFNSLGSVVFKQHISNNTQIDIVLPASIGTGIYFVKCVGDGYISSKKLFLQKE